mgnify:FL=1
MVFNKNDRICFFGDSITAAGDWIGMIADYLIDNRKELKLLPFNCGVAGDNATDAMERMYCDCLQYFPDHVVVMFGMNDICRELYGDNFSSGENERYRHEKIEKYRHSMEKLFSILTQSGIHIIACTPTLYDELQETQSENLRHCNEGLLKCRDIVLSIAEEKGIDVVDFSGKWLEMRENEPKKIIVCQDRVHPNKDGHRVMAETFLKSCGLAEGSCPLLFSEHEINKERMQIEWALRMLAFAQWITFRHVQGGWEHSNAEKMKIFEEWQKNGGPWEKLVHSVYENSQNTIDSLRGNLLRKTISLYAEKA